MSLPFNAPSVRRIFSRSRGDPTKPVPMRYRLCTSSLALDRFQLLISTIWLLHLKLPLLILIAAPFVLSQIVAP